MSTHAVRTLGPADRVTLARAVLVAGVAVLAAAAAATGAFVVMASVALLLDAVDGWVARRTGTATAFGARFDLEVDAVLILVLALHVARELGAWVVLIGAARYGLLLAQRFLPWLRALLPSSRWRKTVAAYQGIVLTIAAAHVVANDLMRDLVLVGLVALGASFGSEVLSLWRLRVPKAGQSPSPAGVAESPGASRAPARLRSLVE